MITIPILLLILIYTLLLLVGKLCKNLVLSAAMRPHRSPSRRTKPSFSYVVLLRACNTCAASAQRREIDCIRVVQYWEDEAIIVLSIIKRSIPTVYHYCQNVQYKCTELYCLVCYYLETVMKLYTSIPTDTRTNTGWLSGKGILFQSTWYPSIY